MATSPVDICNSALIKVGADIIGSLSEQSKEAKLCNQQYDRRRKALLISHPWNFATTRVTLAKTANTPLYDFDFEYVLPANLLRIFEVANGRGIRLTAITTRDPGRANAYQVETNVADNTRVVLSNQDEVLVRFALDLEDTTQFTPSFDEALSFDIAAELAFALTNSVNFAQTMRADAAKALRLARSYDAQEGTPPVVTADLWLNSRF